MRPLRSSPGLLLLLLPLFLAGCASTRGGAPSNIKTVASVGDKALPVVTGESGSTVVADDHIPERSKRAEGRISGRVFDENGEPLSDVRVRLALGNTPGGNFTSATTDRTGAFTLPGLRPGSAYTVIAESDDGQEYLSGRSSVRAPDTDVRITLSSSDSGSQGVADSGPGRVRSVSEREALPDEEEFDPPRVSARNKPRVNSEDLPPAPEAELYEPPARAKAPASSASPAPARSGTSSRGVHWRAVGADGTAQGAGRARDLGASGAPHDSETREAGGLAANPSADDEEVNPLPPALEPAPADSEVEHDEPLPPPVRKRRRSSSTRTGADRQPPAREPGQMSVVPPVSEPEERLPEPASNSSEVNPLPPAREPGQEDGAGASAGATSRGQSPEPQQESGLAFETSAPAGLPPAVESEPTAAFAAAPQPEPAPNTDLFAQAETASSASGALPGPIESSSDVPAPPSSSDFPVPPSTKTTMPGQSELTAEASPFESSPFDTAPSEPSPFDTASSTEPAPAASSALAMAMAADNDQSVFENPETAMAPPPADEMPSEALEPVNNKKRPTWKDLAVAAPQASIPREGGNPKATTTTPATPPPAVGRRVVPTQTSARAAPAPVDAGVVFCKYDPKHRKIEDFRLPDLEGRPVRFQDLGSDLILIDFWGTWCQPCLNSVPHLVDLQKRMDPTKLKVIGIACEQGPTANRAQTVTREVQRLGINYPVLLSGMDGSCPLQDALKVQTYPTLILVNRQGQVLWRAQGATPSNLARLDRVIASASKSDEIRRY